MSDLFPHKTITLQAWIDLLRSGIPQCRGKLATIVHDVPVAFCCLGVAEFACGGAGIKNSTYMSEKWISDLPDEYYYELSEYGQQQFSIIIPGLVERCDGYTSSAKSLVTTDDESLYVTAVLLNDSFQLTFPQIADILEWAFADILNKESTHD